MKPIHEQEWRVRPNNSLMDSGMAFDIIGPDGIVARAVFQREAAFIAAAPDMAQALLMWLPDGHSFECGSRLLDESACSAECAATRKALRKAGILP